MIVNSVFPVAATNLNSQLLNLNNAELINFTGPILSGLDINTYPDKNGNENKENIGGQIGTLPNIGSIYREGGFKNIHFY